MTWRAFLFVFGTAYFPKITGGSDFRRELIERLGLSTLAWTSAGDE